MSIENLLKAYDEPCFAKKNFLAGQGSSTFGKTHRKHGGKSHAEDRDDDVCHGRNADRVQRAPRRVQRHEQQQRARCE